MACGQAKSNANNDVRQSPILKHQGGVLGDYTTCLSWPSVGKQPQGIKKQQAIRKSARIQAIQQLHQQFISKSNLVWEIPALPSPAHANNILIGRKVCPFIPPHTLSYHDLTAASQRPQVPHKPSKAHQKRKRGQEAGHSSPPDRDWPSSKRPWTSPLSCTAEERAATNISEKNVDPLEYWTRIRRWPKEYFEQDSHIREDLNQDSWLEEQMEYLTQVVQYVEINGFRYSCPIRKALISLCRKKSDSSLTGSSNQKKRESKSVAYRDTRYTTLLESKGSYMREFDDNDIPEDVKDLCQTLLKRDQTVPQNSLFRNDIFKKTCRKIEDRNEARVIQDIAQLIVPSAETLVTYSATNLDDLIEGVNKGWVSSIPAEGLKPQPDYSVGFRQFAFTDKQLKKVDLLISSVYETFFFVATYWMYFPFLTCEVKCGAAALDVADWQNAHSMTLAVRSVVKLSKAVKHKKELHQEILVFSILHDHSTVRIYSHYAIIKEDKTTFYRHPIDKFDFTARDGKEKWTAYKFTKNVYDTWMPIQHKRICSAIDDLPSGIDSGLSQSASFSQSEPQTSQQSNAESVGMLEEDESQLSLVGSQEVTPTTSFTQAAERVSKKPRNQRAAGQ